MFAIDGGFVEPCRRDDVDPEIFFANNKTIAGRNQQELAKAICRTCPIQLICLERALQFQQDSGEQLHGIFGGLTEEERAHTTLARLA